MATSTIVEIIEEYLEVEVHRCSECKLKFPYGDIWDDISEDDKPAPKFCVHCGAKFDTPDTQKENKR